MSVRIRTLSAVLLWAGVALAQNPQELPPAPAKAKAAIVDTVARLMDRVYIFPEAGQTAAQRIRAQFKAGVYDTLGTLPDFTTVLTADLRAITHDRHLGVWALPPETRERYLHGDSTRLALRRDEDRSQNQGFEQLRILPGNIGYLKLNRFVPAEEGAPTAIAAMNFLAHADALIFDLRDNGGGEPSMIQLLSSYLFDKPVHLNSFAYRDSAGLQQMWTQAYVDGSRLDKVPVYVLTSENTFSAAEEFSYNLKSLKRGVIVGDTSGGGAHPVADYFLKEWGVLIGIPNARAVNPVTGANWEGVGVIPDLPCAAADALDTAHLAALQKIRAQITRPVRAAAVAWQIESLEARLHPASLAREELARYAGHYGPRRVTLEDDTLYYQRENGPRRRLVPLGQHRFAVADLDYFRVEFVPAKDGSMATFIGHYDDGHSDENARTATP